MEIIGITGSIGCGKTTIAGLIRSLGYVVYDADIWCRKLYYQADFLNVINHNFPIAFENGVFNKRKLRTHVFNDNKELKKLEKIIHPFLKKKFLKTVFRNSRKNNVMFVDVALLFEMGWNKYCTKIIVADVDYEIQKQRVMERDNISANIITSQYLFQPFSKSNAASKKQIQFFLAYLVIVFLIFLFKKGYIKFSSCSNLFLSEKTIFLKNLLSATPLTTLLENKLFNLSKKSLL